MKHLSEESRCLVDGQIYYLNPMVIDLPEVRIIDSFRSSFFSFGSCFAIHMSNSLQKLGFSTYSDDRVCFHYTTKSLLEILNRMKSGTEYGAGDLYYHKNGRQVVSPFHRAMFEEGEGAELRLLKKMNALTAIARSNLQQADIVFLTLGTATYLELNKTRRVICHGGGISFEDYSIKNETCDEIYAELGSIYTALCEIIQKNFHLVLTISPQRYNWDQIANGSILSNNIDKSKLTVAVDRFVNSHRGADIEYFPSYEIVIDELRNYETFQNNHKDYLHVSTPHTTNYTINRFLLSHCSKEVIDTILFYKEKIVPLDKRLYFEPLTQIGAELKNTVAYLGLKSDRLGCGYFVRRLKEILSRHNLDSYTKEISGYETSESILSNIFERVDNDIEKWIKGKKRIIVYGAGFHTDLFMRNTRLGLSNIVAFVDAKYKYVKRIYGVNVISPDEMLRFSPEILFISSASFQEQISKNIISENRQSKFVLYNIYRHYREIIHIQDELRRRYRG